jgi:proteasome assembly chaperone (PAC2) family protein
LSGALSEWIGTAPACPDFNARKIEQRVDQLKQAQAIVVGGVPIIGMVNVVAEHVDRMQSVAELLSKYLFPHPSIYCTWCANEQNHR